MKWFGRLFAQCASDSTSLYSFINWSRWILGYKFMFQKTVRSNDFLEDKNLQKRLSFHRNQRIRTGFSMELIPVSSWDRGALVWNSNDNTKPVELWMAHLCHFIAEGYVRARLNCESSNPLKSFPFLFCHQHRIFAGDRQQKLERISRQIQCWYWTGQRNTIWNIVGESSERSTCASCFCL